MYFINNCNEDSVDVISIFSGSRERKNRDKADLYMTKKVVKSKWDILTTNDFQVGM